MFKKPWLYLPPHWSYFLSEKILDFYVFSLAFKKEKKALVWRPLKWKNLYFPNPLGVAGGLDKNGHHMKAWQALGAGFSEVGTITPLLQKAQPPPRLKRWNQEQVLWNHLGFPNHGTGIISQRLKKWKVKKQQDCLKQPTHFPVFANISKNKNTAVECAEKDFLHCIDLLYPYVDGFVVNISSPNTKNLRQLCHPEKLKPLLKTLVQKLKSLPGENLPLLVKWGPDATEKDFLLSMDTALTAGVDGHILCNSTQKRNFFLKNHKKKSDEAQRAFPAPNYGGLSGSVLTQVSQNLLSLTVRHLGEGKKNQLLISTGGILRPEEVAHRLNLGADLVQVYSAVVFEGPGFFRKTARFMKTREKHQNPVE